MSKKRKRAPPVIARFPGEKGQGLVEYALILVLVAVVVIAILLLLGPVIGNVFSEVTEALNNSVALGSGPLVSVSAVRTGYGSGNDVIVTVTVSKSTTVTVSDSQDASPISFSCSGTCSGTLLGVGHAAGTVTATADGHSKTANYPAQS